MSAPTKTCPHCTETTDTATAVCGHSRRNLEPAPKLTESIGFQDTQELERLETAHEIAAEMMPRYTSGPRPLPAKWRPFVILGMALVALMMLIGIIFGHHN